MSDPNYATEEGEAERRRSAERARIGRLARWLGWSVVAMLTLMTVIANRAAPDDGFAALKLWTCFGVFFVACAVAWVILKALSLPS
jgi:hypothetical protein